VAISPQLMPYNIELIKEKNLSFDILSDPGNKLGHSYGLVYTLPPDLREIYLKFGIDVPLHNGDESWQLPMPARFIIDQEGIIRYAEYDPDYTTRPEPEHTLEALKQLAETPAEYSEDSENTQKAEEA
jgi:peroxiredoxin